MQKVVNKITSDLMCQLMRKWNKLGFVIYYSKDKKSYFGIRNQNISHTAKDIIIKTEICGDEKAAKEYLKMQWRSLGLDARDS